MDARSKTWVDGRSLATIADSNTAGDMSVCLLCLLCVVRWRSLCRSGHSSSEVLPIVVCLTESDSEALIMRRPWHTGGCCAIGGKALHIMANWIWIKQEVCGGGN